MGSDLADEEPAEKRACLHCAGSRAHQVSCLWLGSEGLGGGIPFYGLRKERKLSPFPPPLDSGLVNAGSH